MRTPARDLPASDDRTTYLLLGLTASLLTSAVFAALQTARLRTRLASSR